MHPNEILVYALSYFFWFNVKMFKDFMQFTVLYTVYFLILFNRFRFLDGLKKKKYYTRKKGMVNILKWCNVTLTWDEDNGVVESAWINLKGLYSL